MDYAATTPLDPRVFEAMKPYFITVYGNASSIHSFGAEARQAVEASRKTVAELMNAEPNELIFTGSATEANNMTLKGFAFRKREEKTHIAISSIEHDSVLNPAKWLEKRGVKITYLPVDQYGLIKQEELEKTLKKGISLVSVIHGNNEIGTIQQIKQIGKLCHDYGAYFHTDAAQSFGKIPIDVKAMNMDFMTVNAHKLYGPKGVGALYIKEGTRLEPLLHGGGQERGLRSGTENVPGIVGFGKAAEIARKEMRSESERLIKLRDRLIRGLLEPIPHSYLNGHPTKRLPNNVSVRYSFIEGESMLLSLDLMGVAASSGSACTAKTLEPSHVLLATGLKHEEAHGSLMFSLGKQNTEEEADYVVSLMPGIVKRLRAMSPLTPKELNM